MKWPTLLLLFPMLSFASPEAKYQRGDCITPNTSAYSWYGEFAKVEAYSVIEGFFGKNYILLFPNYLSSTVIFSAKIETDTQKVSPDKCAPKT